VDIVFAQETFVAASVVVVRGSHWPANDPVVVAHRELFTDDPRFGLSFSRPPAEDASAAPVESATAAPGEKRTVKRGQ
jgi:hypothetical protein